MEAFTKMPTVNGKTIGMTRDNCMAYCINKNKGYKHFGEEGRNDNSLTLSPHDRLVGAA